MGALPARRGGAARRAPGPPTGTPAGAALFLLAAGLASLANPAVAAGRRSILSGLEAPAKAQAPGAAQPGAAQPGAQPGTQLGALPGAQQGAADGQRLQPPVAAKRPHKMEQNGDVRVDDYYW
jgi:hypothetical protein